MDYKYIEQLLNRYFQCETTLEEEAILRTFFSQKEVPEQLIPYKDLFTYELKEAKENTLGSDFDNRLAKAIGHTAEEKTMTKSLTYRLKPFFRAAAIVAIIVTLGNAIQAAFDREENNPEGMAYEINRVEQGKAVAKTDSITIDTLKLQ